MKTKKILLAVVMLLLLVSCTTDDMQLETRKAIPKMGSDEVLMKRDSTFYNVSAVIHDSILCGTETDPPPVKPSK